MSDFLGTLSGLFRKQAPPPSSSRSVDELKAEFRTRYHHFKLLLTSASRALSSMNDMEQALRENRMFGMSYIRANVTAVTVNVFRIIQHLDAICPGRYGELSDRLRSILEAIESVIKAPPPPASDRFTVDMAEIRSDLADQVGAKMAGLGEIRCRLSLDVPDGFVITAGAYARLLAHNDLQPEIDRRLQIVEQGDPEELFRLSSEIQGLISRAEVPEDLARALTDACRALEERNGPGLKLSVRSSALGVDGAEASFAGHFRVVLNVGPEDVLDAYRDVLASKYSLAAMSYRLAKGIPDEAVAVPVGCLSMVEAMAGGVAYSRNPVNIRDRSVYISSSWGLPKTVVDGTSATDLFVVSRDGEPAIVDRRIRTKKEQYGCDEGAGVCRLPVPASHADAPSISDDTALALARIAMDLDELYAAPVDLEWAVEMSGRVRILLCRPLRQLDLDARFLDRRVRERDGDSLARGNITAGPGVAAGPVCVVASDLDILRFPEGGVLVSREAQSRWSAVLPRAAAVVTERGSAAGYLANTAREYHVPALFDAPGAVEALAEGQIVTVDADGHAVYDGRREDLLATAAGERKALSMLNTPVARTLEKVLEHIAPLALTDPDSAEFRARNCRSLHDIIRYCHEMAVYEMFDVSSDDELQERTSKQIVTESPMQWWVLNLDDGFTHDVPGKFIRLDEIACEPMLAVWRGLSAFPWEGPPPVDSRGFMAIMYQTTTNPELEGPASSSFLVKNYFMLSRNYMTLSSRFGYHLTTIEALVGERHSENFVNFQFKGGAAEFERRQRRAFFVASILEEWGFKAEVTEDAVFARVEGEAEEYMMERLMILGYLIIHTRQLDMIMKLRAQVEKHRSKIMTEIAEMLADQGSATSRDKV